MTARNSGVVPGDAAAVVAVTSQSVEGGVGMSLFSVTRGWRLGKVLKSWRRVRAVVRSVEGGRGVRVVMEWVVVRTGRR